MMSLAYRGNMKNKIVGSFAQKARYTMSGSGLAS